MPGRATAVASPTAPVTACEEWQRCGVKYREVTLESPIEIHGEHATMEYGEHARAQLTLEGERWVIVDPD